MERPLPSLPSEREPRSAGHPPLGRPREIDAMAYNYHNAFPGPVPSHRYSEPDLTRSRPPMPDYPWHYSTSSTVSSNSSTTNGSLFGSSYSVSSASSDARRPSRGESGYLSPPDSRRTSETNRPSLPSIHELAKTIPDPIIEMPASGLSPPKSDSFRAPPPRNPPPSNEQMAFPPKYPGSQMIPIQKQRAQSFPQAGPRPYPPPQFTPTASSPVQFHGDPHGAPIPRAFDKVHLLNLCRANQEMSRDLHYFFEHASRELDSGHDHSAFPSMEELNHQLRQIDKMQSNLQEVLRLRSAHYPYGSIFVKHEEDPRMMDVMPSNGYAARPVSPGSVSGNYQDGPEFWNSDHPEHGRSKYKKRSRAAPPGECHSCHVQSTPEWRRGPDGARTLCNACGLHYAKVNKRKERECGSEDSPNGQNQHQPLNSQSPQGPV